MYVSDSFGKYVSVLPSALNMWLPDIFIGKFIQIFLKGGGLKVPSFKWFLWKSTPKIPYLKACVKGLELFSKTNLESSSPKSLDGYGSFQEIYLLLLRLANTNIVYSIISDYYDIELIKR